MIEILLATYQGEKFLAEQLDSIIGQTFKDWILLIHDDGSSDGTIDLVKKYMVKYPSKIKLIEDGVVKKNSKENFQHLLFKSQSNYIAFCDQDDIWNDNKLATGMKEILKLEKIYSINHPIIFCSDTEIVDYELKTISISGWKYSRLSPKIIDSAKSLAVRNYLTGCTMIVNRAAIDVSTPIPNEAIIHDWWIGLCVLKTKGSIIHSKIPLVKYRQHNSNVMGIKVYKYTNYIKRFINISSTFKEFYSVYKMARTAGVFIKFSEFIYYKIKISIRVIRYYAF